MTSCCRFLFTHKNFAHYPLRAPPSRNRLAGSFANWEPNLMRNHTIHSYPYRLFGLRPAISYPQGTFRLVESGFGSPTIRGLVADVKRCSSSTFDPRANDKNSERVCATDDADLKERNVECDRVHGACHHKEEDDTIAPGEVKQGLGSDVEQEAWKLLRNSVVMYCNSPVGTVAANDPNDKLPLNYDQVFIRDFGPSALAFLLKGDSDIVKNFLLHTLQLQLGKTVDCYRPRQGLMPASFKASIVPIDGNNEKFKEVLDPDFGESVIGRVAPVDSGLWWIILLRAYGKLTGDYTLQERVDVQTGLKLILSLCLTDGFDMFPSLLVTDGSCMIDRRMGIHGHPLEIQRCETPERS